MNKINITDKDYTYNGMGYNDFNFINNVVPRISQWLINEFFAVKDSHSVKRQEEFASKLNQIGRIIDDLFPFKEKVEAVEQVINDEMYYADCELCQFDCEGPHSCGTCSIPYSNNFLLSDKVAHDIAVKIVKALAYYSGETDEFYDTIDTKTKESLWRYTSASKTMDIKTKESLWQYTPASECQRITKGVWEK